MEPNYLIRAPTPIVNKREDPRLIDELESTNKLLADKSHILEQEKSVLQTETEKRVLPEDPIIQQNIDDAAEKKAQQYLDQFYLIPKNDPKVALEFVGKFCEEYGFDLFSTNDSPVNLCQLLPGVTLPQETQGPPNTSIPGQHTWNGPQPSINGGGFGNSQVPTTVTPASATNPSGGFNIFGSAGGSGNPTTTTPPAAGPGFPGGFRAASNPQAITTKAPEKAKNPDIITITFVNQDPGVPSVDIDIPRHQTLTFCQTIYRNHKFGTASDGSDLTLGSSSVYPPLPRH
ncbi:hypothetical protein E2P81_ATG00857 [Venturia nashicola]|nr:hypothetical protein E2P81_ATG00857 [Venturia nashicola]